MATEAIVLIMVVLLGLQPAFRNLPGPRSEHDAEFLQYKDDGYGGDTKYHPWRYPGPYGSGSWVFGGICGV